MFDRILKHPLLMESLVCIGIGRKPKAESISKFFVLRHSHVETFNRLIALRNRFCNIMQLLLHVETANAQKYSSAERIQAECIYNGITSQCKTYSH